MTDPRRYTRPTIILIGLCLVVYFLGLAQVPLIDRDEPRFAQCSRQMLQSGDWVLPRYLDDIRLAKPPLIYWLQASSMAALGETPFAARLPSTIGMTATLLLVFFAVRRELSAEHAFWTVLVLGSSTLAVVAAKVCLTDAVLLLFITAGQLCIYRMWTGRGGWGTWAVFGLAVGLQLLTKGPVGLGVHLLTLLGWAFLTWSLRWRKRGNAAPADAPADAPAELPAATTRRSTASLVGRVAMAIGIVLAVCLPWVVLVEQRWKAVPAAEREKLITRLEGRRDNKIIDPARFQKGYIETVLYYEVFERSKTGQEGHKGPPGFYALTIWGTYLPWSLVLPATLVTAWINRRQTYVRFALAAVVGPWLMFEAVQTKLPHYFLPCFVPLAILSADVIVRCVRGTSTALSDLGFRRGVVAWAMIVAILFLIPWAPMVWFRPLPWIPMVLVTVGGFVYAAVAVALLSFRVKLQDGIAWLGLGALGLSVLITRGWLPECQYLQISQKVAAILQQHGATGRGDVLMLDYKEPSLGFYQGGTIRENSNSAITPGLLQTTGATWWVVTDEVWNATKPEIRAQFTQAGDSVTGLDVADELRKVTVRVLKRNPSAQK
jgi:4-amino-4-deoxy-L-arabinose transferase-like glycosyltransferase